MKHKFHSANPVLIGCSEPVTDDFLKSFQLFTSRIIYNRGSQPGAREHHCAL